MHLRPVTWQTLVDIDGLTKQNMATIGQVQEDSRTQAYRFFLFLHPSRHFRDRPVDSGKIWQIWYLISDVDWHGLAWIESLRSKGKLAHPFQPS